MEQLVEMSIDVSRNQMMKMNMQLAIGTLGMSGMSAVASIFGMNLWNHYEKSELLFFMLPLV